MYHIQREARRAQACHLVLALASLLCEPALQLDAWLILPATLHKATELVRHAMRIGSNVLDLSATRAKG